MVNGIEHRLEGNGGKKVSYMVYLTSQDGSKVFQICSSYLQPCTDGAEGETMAAPVEEEPAGMAAPAEEELSPCMATGNQAQLESATEEEPVECGHGNGLMEGGATTRSCSSVHI